MCCWLSQPLSDEHMKVIKRYVSNLDNDLILALISLDLDKYVVEIFGEECVDFQSEAEAIWHTESALKNFYVSK